MPTVTLSQNVIYYEDRGPRSASTAIVLVHGFPLDGRIFRDQLESLSNEYRVIVPDLRGFGYSPCDQPFTIASLADDVHALLEHLNALPCVVGGLSMGGYVVQAFAKKYPADLAGLMLLATKSEADSAEGKIKRNAMIETVRTGGSAAIADAMFPNMITNEHAADPSIATQLRAMMETCAPKTIEHALIAMRDREDYRSLLPSLAIPTLIVAGEHDSVAPRRTIEEMVASIPRVTTVMLPDAAHIVTMEKPDDVSRAIRDFMRTLME